mmetsp:Transcript_25949/g.65858  ORF Transcript_25949/g.65858 Transcript_25949/m.65858 type:complete len:231 (-) Transcript_25949:677-1369(-)
MRQVTATSTAARARTAVAPGAQAASRQRQRRIPARPACWPGWPSTARPIHCPWFAQPARAQGGGAPYCATRTAFSAEPSPRACACEKMSCVSACASAVFAECDYTEKVSPSALCMASLPGRETNSVAAPPRSPAAALNFCTFAVSLPACCCSAVGPSLRACAARSASPSSPLFGRPRPHLTSPPEPAPASTLVVCGAGGGFASPASTSAAACSSSAGAPSTRAATAARGL